MEPSRCVLLGLLASALWVSETTGADPVSIGSIVENIRTESGTPLIGQD